MLKDYVPDVQPCPVAALHNVLCGGDCRSHYVNLCLKPDAAHPKRLLYSILVVYNKLLGKDMYDLPVHRDVHCLCRIYDPLYVGIGNLSVPYPYDPVAVNAFDVTASYSGIDGGYLAAGHQLRLFNRLLYGADGGLNVYNNAFSQPLGGVGPDPYYVKAVLPNLANNGADLCCSYVEANYYLFILSGHLPLLFSSNNHLPCICQVYISGFFLFAL